MSDNANVVMGNKESFKTYLLDKNPNIIVYGCICHSVHLVASAASECLPSNIESLLHIYMLIFREIQNDNQFWKNFKVFSGKKSIRCWLQLEQVGFHWEIGKSIQPVGCFDRTISEHGI